ncbi:MAG: hypothetical protein P4L46_18135 [Fimbriimonas sp.]|nr:hypothetical protein [Fimbriimonas sp.]
MISARFSLLLSICLVSALSSARLDGVLLRKTLKSGIETYHLVSVVKQTITMPDNGGDQALDISRTATYTFKIGAVDQAGGIAPVELTTKTDQIDFKGALAELLKSQSDNDSDSKTMKGNIDELNRFVSADASKVDPMSVINGSTNTSVAGLFIQFPEKPVNIGDTWDVTIPKGPITGKKDQKLTAKLVSLTKVADRDIYVLSLIGKVKTDIDVAELVKNSDEQVAGFLGQLNMVITGDIEFDCQANVDKATGQTLLMTMKTSTNQTMVTSDKKFKSKGTSSVTLALQP